MPKKERNPNRIRRQPTPDSPPPRDQGARESPRSDEPDWVEVGHLEADSDSVPTTHGMGAGGGKPKKPRVEP